MTQSIVSACVLLALASTGCGGDEKRELSDGRHFGYIRSVDATSRPPTLRFDVAEWLTGERAERAAITDGAIEPGEGVSNDYYVRNARRDAVVLVVAERVRVTAVRCPNSCKDGIRGSFRGLARSFADSGPKTLADEYRGPHSQYWLMVDGGRVTAIDEQYVP